MWNGNGKVGNPENAVGGRGGGINCVGVINGLKRIYSRNA